MKKLQMFYIKNKIVLLFKWMMFKTRFKIAFEKNKIEYEKNKNSKIRFYEKIIYFIISIIIMQILFYILKNNY